MIRCFLSKLKALKHHKLDQFLPKTRICWNYKKFNIHPLRGYDAEMSRAGFEIEVEKRYLT
jgi:hypothetical protein